MTTRNYKHKQNNVSRYVILCVLVNSIALSVGIASVTASSKIAYQVGATEKQIAQMQYDIALLENEYHVASRDMDVLASENKLVAFGPSSAQLRYAQVGGSVYSLLTQ